MKTNQDLEEFQIDQQFQENLRNLAQKYSQESRRRLYIYLHEWLIESKFPDDKQTDSILLQKLKDNQKNNKKYSNLEFGVYLNITFREISKNTEMFNLPPVPESFMIRLITLEKLSELKRTYERRSDKYKQTLNKLIAKYDSKADQPAHTPL